MSQRDMRDPWWVPAPLEWPPMTKPIKVALARIPADMDTDPEVIGLVRTAADHLASAGYDVTEADVPDLPGTRRLWCDLIIVGASRGGDARAGGDRIVAYADGAVFSDDRILSVCETADGHRWLVAGRVGGFEREPCRDRRQGSGRGGQPTGASHVWDSTRHPHKCGASLPRLAVVLLCEITGGELQTGSATSDAAFVAEHGLPSELSTLRFCFPN
jgi:hypothetical protein